MPRCLFTQILTLFTDYDDSLPVILSRDDLAAHMKKYASTFNLNILHSSRVEGSSFNTTTRMWTIKVRTPAGSKIVRSKHLVQCTGIGGSKGFVPNLPGAEEYQGVNIHSERYKNPRTLTDQGAKVRETLPAHTTEKESRSNVNG